VAKERSFTKAAKRLNISQSAVSDQIKLLEQNIGFSLFRRTSGGIELTARDESRHIRYGVYLLQRLVSEDPAIWEVINRRMNQIFPHAMGVIAEFWEPYDEANGPFGLTMNEFVEFSAAKFDARMKVMERDRGKDMADIEKAVLEDLEADERELSEAFA